MVQKPGKDIGIVDYLSREANGEPWPESKLDEKLLVASIDQFHKALDCLNSRLIDTTDTNSSKIENIIEHSEPKYKLYTVENTSSQGCYSNRSVQKRTGLDRNENGQNSRFSNCEPKTLSKISYYKQSVDTNINREKTAKEK